MQTYQPVAFVPASRAVASGSNSAEAAHLLGLEGEMKKRDTTAEEKVLEIKYGLGYDIIKKNGDDGGGSSEDSSSFFRLGFFGGGGE
uniref:Uncharacterized protein n=1 Tax=Chromera velia CCMP2878 TaxID=1169474 RepID=A0A0G4HPP7_9ALVE|eukprot:Cvel_30020.t1-p1 / transcript=Cvel_30020.t1 / gene=Cvel_30020 / organism=Chromera_velia_CCMP2878 / gene_product=hypothetical protein / transcript_product=hypothetical protein / location=Cvel_scaffold4216:7898-8802(+) / protein_length=86 / sequence_SO=supercontig / SO=protein_coding / is_pseudo=false